MAHGETNNYNQQNSYYVTRAKQFQFANCYRL